MRCNYCNREIGDGGYYYLIHGMFRKEFCSEKCLNEYERINKLKSI